MFAFGKRDKTNNSVETITALHKAIEGNDLVEVQRLVKKQHANVEAQIDSDGWTALHRACYKGHVDMVRYLVEKCGAKVTATNSNGNTTLHKACDSGNLQVVRYLVESCGADVFATTTNGRWTALHKAVIRGNLDVVGYLVEQCDGAGAHIVQTSNDDGDTALLMACRCSDYTMVRYLVERCGANLFATNKIGHSALHKAAVMGNLQVVQYLVETCGVNLHSATQNNESALEIAFRYENHDAVAYLSAKATAAKPTVSSTSLPSRASPQSGQLDIRASASEPAALNISERNQSLHEAVCVADNLAAVRYLVEQQKADVHATNAKGETALHYACYFGNIEAARYLIESCGANVETTAHNGATALHQASRSRTAPMVRYLVEACRANVKAVTHDGWTALHHAGRDSNLETVLYLVESCQVNVHAQTKSTGATVLHLACFHNRKLEVIRYLVETCGAQLDSTDKDGSNALHYACDGGNLDTVRYLVDSSPNNTFLLKAVTRQHETALALAQTKGHADVVAYLYRVHEMESGKNHSIPVAETASLSLRATQVPHSTGMEENSNAGGGGRIQPARVDTNELSSKDESGGKVDRRSDPPGMHSMDAPDAGPRLKPASPDKEVLPDGDDSIEVGKNSNATMPTLMVDPRDKAAPTMDCTSDQDRVREAVLGTTSLETFVVSESYIKSVLTDDVLGRGFFGTVYRGVDSAAGRSVVIKAINPEILVGGSADEVRRAKQSFEKEQQTLSHFRHPNIARLLAYSFPTYVRGSYYLVYELAEKGSLDAFLQTRDELKRLRLSFRRRVQIALDITTALRFLHVGNVERNVKSCFHRDVKSANIVLKQDLTAQLIDCGLAKFVVDKTDNGMAQAVSSNAPKGTPGYICPEYAHGEITCFDCACDVYSLGVVLVELWTGKLQNQLDGSGSPFNFAAQYIKLKKGKTVRDILADADSTFGYAPRDVFPDYMIQFAVLAKNCMGDHEDIPHGKDVLNELEAIRQSCLADENGSSTISASSPTVAPKPTAMEQQVCDRCQSFPVVSGGSTCRMCWDAEQQRTDIRGMRHEILLLLQTLGDESKATGTVLNTILQGVQTTSSHVQTMSSVLGDLDMRISNPIPRLFFVVPAERKNALLHPKEYLHRSIATKYYLYFVCAHTKRPVDAPIKIHMTKSWVQKVAPVLAVSLHLLRCALSVLGLQVNLQGVLFQLSEGAVDDMLTEVAAIIKDSGSHSDLLSHLAHRTLPFDVADVPELDGDVYDHLIEKATEQREWRQYMEPVRTRSNAATLWVAKEVAEDARHGYIKAR